MHNTNMETGFICSTQMEVTLSKLLHKQSWKNNERGFTLSSYTNEGFIYLCIPFRLLFFKIKMSSCSDVTFTNSKIKCLIMFLESKLK